jgi:hypothetical protein
MKKWINKYILDFTLINISGFFRRKEFDIEILFISFHHFIRSAPYRNYTVRGLLSIEYFKKELWISIFFINFNWYFGKRFKE